MQVGTDTGDGLPLRGWQRRALVKYLAAQPRDFLAVATPGVFGPDYFLEIAAVIAAADGPPDPRAMAAVMLRHGLTPALS